MTRGQPKLISRGETDNFMAKKKEDNKNERKKISAVRKVGIMAML